MSKAIPKDRVVWCDRGWMPTYYGFCPSEKAWRREMKRLAANDGMDVERVPYPTADARATSLEADGKRLLYIVTVSERLNDQIANDPAALCCLMVHEAVHVWQGIREHIGEKSPSIEFEAYSIQAITLNLVDAFKLTRGLPSAPRKRKTGKGKH